MFNDVRGVGESLGENVCVDDTCEGLTICMLTLAHRWDQKTIM